MNSNEWPLVLFTVLAQSGTGMVMALLTTTVLFRSQGIVNSEDIRKGVIFLAAIFTGTALMISFLHLARPAHSIYALQGIGTSWLSREIVMVALFFGLLVMSWLLMRSARGRRSLHTGILLVLIIVGIVMIYSMIRLYMLPTIPVWNNASTPVSFLNTALLLGPAFLLCTIMVLAKPTLEPASAKPVVALLMVVIFAGVLIHVLNASLLIPKDISPAAALAPPATALIWHIARWFFLFVGLACMIIWYAVFRQDSPLAGPWLLFAGSAGLLLAEVVSRYLFYASYYRIGI